MDPKRLEFLSRPENIGELRQLLLYHILPGETLAADFASGPRDTLLPNFTVDISVDPLMFDDASIIEPDTLASNGIFNIIDTVLDPFIPTSAYYVPVGRPCISGSNAKLTHLVALLHILLLLKRQQDHYQECRQASRQRHQGYRPESRQHHQTPERRFKFD